MQEKRVIPDKDAQLMLECSDSDPSSINSDIDSDHSNDNVAMIDTLVNYYCYCYYCCCCYNEAGAASAECFVWENVKLQRTQGAI
jgi:hypothetical protein